MLRIVSLLVVLFYLLIEIIASTTFADAFGVFGLFLEVIVSSILGVSLLLNFRGIILHSLYMLYSGKIDKTSMVMATLMQIVGSILLIAPGVVSDVLGVLLIVLGFLKVGFVMPSFKDSDSGSYREVRRDDDIRHVPDEDIIDVEVISKRRQI